MQKYLELAQQILNQNYYAVGVRSVCEDEKYVVGDDCRQSYDWDVENDCSTYQTTGELAGGTCATHIDTQAFDKDDRAAELAERIAEIVKTNSVYGGQQIIIAGNSVNNDMMNDPGEVRIRNAFVIAVL
jgi:hypothetical protein